MQGLTIVARNYLPQARVLSRTFLAQHPTAKFWTLVIDGVDEDRAEPGAGNILLIDDLDLPRSEWRPMAAMYDVMELATALKPAALRHLLRHHNPDAGAVAYIDPDIHVMTPFVEVFDDAIRIERLGARWIAVPELGSP